MTGRCGVIVTSLSAAALRNLNMPFFLFQAVARFFNLAATQQEGTLQLRDTRGHQQLQPSSTPNNLRKRCRSASYPVTPVSPQNSAPSVVLPNKPLPLTRRTTLDIAPRSSQIQLQSYQPQTSSSEPSTSLCITPTNRRNIDATVTTVLTALLASHYSNQMVILGDMQFTLAPPITYHLTTYVISPHPQLLPHQIPVNAYIHSQNWPPALLSAGFNARHNSRWLLRIEHMSEPLLLRQLKAVANLASPGSIAVLFTYSPIAQQLAEEAGFCADSLKLDKPLLYLQRKQPHITAHIPLTPETASPHNQTCDSHASTHLARFELSKHTIPHCITTLFATTSAVINIVGSREELGFWSPEKGLNMVDAGDTFVADIIIADGPTFYKYVAIKADNIIVWEHGDDRVLPQHTPQLVRVTDSWRQF